MRGGMANSEGTPRRPAKRVRCAIYTRKSSDEGLEQAFNSLDAQREACTAFILSQKHEGWTVLPAQYDDGGYSGGTMERPALKRLLADIEASQVDVVVVYKVDRLTRALSDFAKLVETLTVAAFRSYRSRSNSTPRPAWDGSRSMCCYPSPNLSARSLASACVIRSLPRKGRACGWEACHRSDTT